MNERDKEIILSLERFRCLTRDHIAAMYFSNTKHPIKNTNIVLKRLRRDGHITVNINVRPYVYFPSKSITKNSQKIEHYLGIADIYIQMCAIKKPKLFVVEPKYTKEYMEPDVFAIWNGGVFFIEYQRAIYSKKVMKEKMERYEKFYYSGVWKNEGWQPKDKKVFPWIIIVSEFKQQIETNLSVKQVKKISDLSR